jgi:hypothetical protein
MPLPYPWASPCCFSRSKRPAPSLPSREEVPRNATMYIDSGCCDVHPSLSQVAAKVRTFTGTYGVDESCKSVDAVLLDKCRLDNRSWQVPLDRIGVGSWRKALSRWDRIRSWSMVAVESQHLQRLQIFSMLLRRDMWSLQVMLRPLHISSPLPRMARFP